MVTDSEIQTLTHLSQALWSDPVRSRKISVETLAAVSLQGLTPQAALERAALALVERAARDGAGTSGQRVDLPFYRLMPEERFALMALHREGWTYEQIAKTLGEPADEVEEMVWSARLHLGCTLGKAKYPTGPSQNNASELSASCPEYNVKAPWTQAFMDESQSTQKRMFLQNHLMACIRCRSALSQCRELYYEVERMIPAAEVSRDTDLVFQRFMRAQVSALRPSELSFKDSLQIFLSRRDIRWILAGITAAFILSLIFD